MTQKQINEFCKAAQAGDLEKIRELLKAGVSPSVQWSAHLDKAPVALAGANGHEEVFFELVKAGADLHARQRYGSTVLTTLAEKRGTLRMVQAVIADGIKPSDDLPAALRYACADGDVEVVKALIEAGADVNHKHPTWGTPLLSAVRQNRVENVAALLQAGAKTEGRMPRLPFGEQPHYKKTALEIALAEGYREIVALLEAAGAKVPEKPRRSVTAGSIAESWKRIKKWLTANAPGWKALKKGASPGQIDRAEQKLGFPLPGELRESYLLHNGSADIFPNPDDIAFYLMPLDEVVRAWTFQKELLEGADFEGGEVECSEGIRQDWWNVHWLPFSSNGGGDFFCIDLAPAAGGTLYQVISSNHENGEHKLLAPSLREWLHQLANDLEDGKYSYDEDEGLV